MEFAKLHAHAAYNLATSGMESFPIAELPVRWEELEITGPSFYGFPPLQQRLAKHCGVPENCVVPAIGTSLANHLALAAIANPGEEILVEDPTYELITSTAEFLGLRVRTFPRRVENSFAVDPADLRKRVTAQTRAIVLCNLHNPSSMLTGEDTLRELAAIARQNGIRILVDEVYLDAAFDIAPRSAVHLAPEVFVITSSLTKAYGLSGLRCGWVLADEKLAERVWHINDLFSSVPAHPAELLSIVAFDNLTRIRERARAILQRNRPLLEAFLESRDDLEYVLSPHGTTAFPRLKHGSVEALFELLRSKYEAALVPGKFFGMPQHFRIGIGGNTEMTAEGLRRLGEALDEFRS